MDWNSHRICWSGFCFLLVTASVSASAETEVAALQDEVKILKQEVNTLNKTTAMLNKKVTLLSAEKKQTLPSAAQTKQSLSNSANQSASNKSSVSTESSSPATLAHISGYADAGYVNQGGQNDHFFLGHFNPIFSMSYRNLLIAEGELELEINNEGQTETNLEYADLGLFVNNYMMFIIGKMISPLGYFEQNLHPSWINKLPTNPPGFAHEQAAPEAEIGMQLRGAIPVWNPAKINYSLFVSNGPEAEVDANEIEAIETGGFNADGDSGKVVGGRIGFQPLPNMEFGVSGAAGRVGLFDQTMIDRRDYSVLGADASYFLQNLQLRGEIIQQDIPSKSDNTIPGGKWRGWYGQSSYRFMPTKFEGVVRYGQYTAPEDDQDFNQWALGLDYWFAPSIVAKIDYEFNHATHPDEEDNSIDNAFYFQLAYGF